MKGHEAINGSKLSWVDDFTVKTRIKGLCTRYGCQFDEIYDSVVKMKLIIIC